MMGMIDKHVFRLLTAGMSPQLVDELAMTAVRVNYGGQTPDSLHGFVGSVALAGAEDGLWAVKGGNKQERIGKF
jgi:hypothetical protein